MRSGSLIANVLAALLLWLALSGAAPVSMAADGLPSEAQVAEAVRKVEADPNLARERTVKRLKWAGKAKGSKAPQMSFPEWLGEALLWIAQSVRVLMWVGIAVLVALLAVLILRRIARLERGSSAVAPPPMPTHVRDLDIRPESLPDDIGAAAFALWERGEHRAALALLYRGLLSRLVHVHAVPIKASSTEGDCLDLARQHLPSQFVPYARELIGTWQHAVYGARDPDTEQVRTLCSAFERAAGTPHPHAVSA